MAPAHSHNILPPLLLLLDKADNQYNKPNRLSFTTCSSELELSHQPVGCPRLSALSLSCGSPGLTQEPRTTRQCGDPAMIRRQLPLTFFSITQELTSVKKTSAPCAVLSCIKMTASSDTNPGLVQDRGRELRVLYAEGSAAGSTGTFVLFVTLF